MSRENDVSEDGKGQLQRGHSSNQCEVTGGSQNSRSEFGKKVGLTLVGILLLATVTGANASIAADRTVLNADYVSETLDEYGVSANFAGESREELAGDLERAGIADADKFPAGISLADVDPDEIAAQSLTEEYVRSEMSRNIEMAYAFLHGDRDDLSLTIDLQPVKESVADTIGESVRIDTPALVGAASERVSKDRVAALEESEESFQDAQMDVSDRERQQLEDEMEEDVRQQLQGEPESLVEAALALQEAVVHGLTDELTYDEYVDRLEDDEQRLATEVTAVIQQEIDEDVPDELDLTDDENGDSPGEDLAPVATGFQYISTATWLLSLVILGLVGLVYGITRSPERTASTVGSTFLVAGLVGIVVAFGLSGYAIEMVEEDVAGGEEPGDTFEAAITIVESAFDVLGTQSILLAVGGIGLFALAFVSKRGHLDGVKETLGTDETSTGSTESNREGTQQPSSEAQNQQSDQVSEREHDASGLADDE